MKELLKKYLPNRALEFLRTLRWLLRGSDFIIKIEVKLSCKNLGSYGDAMSVYLGERPSHLVVYSAGIGDKIDFELQLLKEPNVQIYAFDPTPMAIKYFSNNFIGDGMQLLSYAVTDSDGEISFYLPGNEAFISGSLEKQINDERNLSGEIRVQGKRISSIMKELGHGCVDILKMDIEGAEFDVLEDIALNNANVKQILVDFHNRYIPDGKKKLKRCLKIMSENGYKVFAVNEYNKAVSFIKMP